MPFVTSATTQVRTQQIADLQGNTHTLPADYPIPHAALVECLHELYGRAVFPGDPSYDRDRATFNTAYSAAPRLLVYCTCISDVRAALKLAGASGLPVTARSGGHSMAGYSVCDGIVIDVSEMNSVVVSPESRTAVVGPGTDFHRLNAQLESVGLHLPGGSCSSVCVAGYMQGGGYGFTSRLFGMNSDNVLSFQMVLADGSLVTATPSRNADLFWAVRGGTGNQFGIVVEIVYQLHPLGQVWGARLDWSLATDLVGAARALGVVQNEYIAGDAHPRIGVQILIGVDPDIDSSLRLAVLAMFDGGKAGFDKTLEPLKAIPGCVEVRRMQDRYSTVNETLPLGIPALDPARLKGALTQSCYIPGPLAEDDWRRILERTMRDTPNALTTVGMEAYGGRIRRVGVTDSAFIHRDVSLDFFLDVFWEDDADRDPNVDWHREFMEFVAPYGNGHSYQNYPCRSQRDWRWAYFGPYLPTLVRIKSKFDPTNVFRIGQAISPDPDDAHRREYAEILFASPDIVRDEAR